MKVAIVSPGHGAGVTAATLLIGHYMAHTKNTSVCLVYTGINEDIKNYIGYSEEPDITRSVEQACELLRADAIGVENIPEFFRRVNSNVSLLDSVDGTVPVEESTELLAYVLKKINTDIVLCDIGTSIEEASTIDVLHTCDVVLFVSPPSYYDLEIIRRWREEFEIFKGKVCGLLITKYDPVVAPLSLLARKAGFSVRDTCKLHYNAFITEGCNKKNLDTLVPYIVNKDPRVVELNMALEEVTKLLRYAKA